MLFISISQYRLFSLYISHPLYIKIIVIHETPQICQYIDIVSSILTVCILLLEVCQIKVSLVNDDFVFKPGNIYFVIFSEKPISFYILKQLPRTCQEDTQFNRFEIREFLLLDWLPNQG